MFSASFILLHELSIINYKYGIYIHTYIYVCIYIEYLVVLYYVLTLLLQFQVAISGFIDDKEKRIIVPVLHVKD